MNSVDHQVDAILDFSRGDKLPKGGALYQAKYVVQNRPTNAGLIVFVKASLPIKALGQTFNRLNAVLAQKTAIYYADDLAEAYERIANSRDK